MMWNYGPWGMFPWMWIFPLICLIALLSFHFRPGGLPMGNKYGPQRQEESAHELLARRYARGEISREEYLQIKSDLE